MRHKSLVFTGLIALCSSCLTPQTALSQPAPGQRGWGRWQRDWCFFVIFSSFLF